MGHVVEFPVRLPEADVFAHEDLARLFGIWRQEVRMNGSLPRLHAFAPRQLGSLMSFSAIVEMREEGDDKAQWMPSAVVWDDHAVDMRWRLAGSGLCRLAGEELAGRPVFDDWQRFERATLRRLMHQALTAEQAFMARLRLDALSAVHMDDHMEMLALPLRDGKECGNVVLLAFGTAVDMHMIVPQALRSARLTSLRTLTSVLPEAHAAGAAAGDAMHPAVVLPLFERRKPA